ncbi:TIM barrel protein [Alteromonas sp. 1_MG-2023]|uniref:sugar phosphate isomerase/epimerase family protein n=1 Tax=Alteromonas sp. 1_MG-2023 TaxID=3062669 RepID=UPI0026E3DE28|nr:TIM barrel protein [Alteromonas sp. 1_MG-2023]MDO6475251.1 TIM barrel protein [Alteromonas sp. 1_MG-2023]
MAIKRGVSLYSYQNETFLGEMTLDDCIRVCAEMGANGIEVIGEQSFWGHPEQSIEDAAIEGWHASIKKHGAVPVALDFMIDYKRYKGRIMTLEEQVESIKKDIALAKRLGTPFMRVLVSIDPDVLVAAAPFAEEAGVKLLVEVHAPLHFDHPWILRHAEAFDKSGSDVLGFLPDMGMFLDKFPPCWKARFIRNGVPQNIADYIEKAYEDRVLSEYVIQNVREMGGTGPSLGMAETLRHNAAYAPERMLPHMNRIHNIHGKFYEMTEDCIEPAIPYERIIQVLTKGNYDGYICSEYEGNRWIEDAHTVDSVEQVRRQQKMLENLINKYQR